MIGVFGCKNEVKNNTITIPKNKDEQIFNKKKEDKPGGKLSLKKKEP